MPDAGIDQTTLIKLIRQYLEQNPTTNYATLNVANLVVSDLMVVEDQVAFSKAREWRYIGSQGQPVFTNSWVAYGTPYANPGFMLLPDGFVQLHGVMKGGTVGSTAFQLPPGYRPSGTVPFIVFSNGTAGRVDVAADGTVTPMSPSTSTSVALEQIRFKAA